MAKDAYTFWQQTYYYLVKRFLLKSVVPFVLTGAVALATNNPKWMVLTPVLQLAEKFLRDKGYWFNY